MGADKHVVVAKGGGSSLGWAAGWEGMVGRGLARREGRESS